MIGLLLARAGEVPGRDDGGWLLPAERAVLARLHVERRRDDWRLGRWAAKQAVHAALGVPVETVEIRAADDGAPEAWRDGAPLPVSISLSHRDGTAVCAVALPAAPLGVDVERVEPRAAVFAADWFTDSERRLLAAAPAAERDLLTTVLWSAKESVLKLQRCGLRRDPRELVVSGGHDPMAGSGWHRLAVRGTEGDAATAVWWQERPPLVVTVAAGPLG